MLSKGGSRPETDGLRDFIDGIACRFEQPLGIQQALMSEPLVRRRSGLFPKPSGKGPGGHERFLRQFIHGQRLVQVFMGPLQNRRKATAGFSADWMKHELCLATLSMRRHN